MRVIETDQLKTILLSFVEMHDKFFWADSKSNR